MTEIRQDRRRFMTSQLTVTSIDPFPSQFPVFLFHHVFMVRDVSLLMLTSEVRDCTVFASATAVSFLFILFVLTFRETFLKYQTFEKSFLLKFFHI